MLPGREGASSSSGGDHDGCGDSDNHATDHWERRADSCSVLPRCSRSTPRGAGSS
jgi:hypothetical protein